MLRVKRLVLIVVLPLLIAGCGQKYGVAGSSGEDLTAQAGTESPGEVLAPGTEEPGAAGTVEGEGGTGIATGAAAPAAGTPAARTGTGAGATSGTPKPGAAAPKPGTATGGTPTAGTPSGAVTPGGPVDRTGVSDKEIVIGVHAPVTGAAPLPQDNFEKGRDVYWKFLATKGGVFGRNVKVIFKDDQFQPSRAVQVCREMAEQQKAFLLIGAAGSEQITACARYASSKGIPYLSAGVNEDGVRGQATYFALSMSYEQQSPMLAQLAKKQGKSKLAIVVNNSPALTAVVNSMTAAAQKVGLQIVRTSRINKNASETEILTEAGQLKSSGADVVYVLTSPTQFIRLATGSQSQGYAPLYIGPGITNGLNAVASAGCPAVAGAKFLSPFPQLDVIDSLDADFRPAYRTHAGGEPDDIGISLWGLNKAVGAMLQAAGQDLSRQSFLSAITSGKEFATRVFPPFKFSAANHFGSTQAHLLEADCSKRQFKTVAQFVAGF
jgi:ABC-type branched-subunit amino acid transport system substrate-binding protein